MWDMFSENNLHQSLIWTEMLIYNLLLLPTAIHKQSKSTLSIFLAHLCKSAHSLGWDAQISP